MNDEKARRFGITVDLFRVGKSIGCTVATHFLDPLADPPPARDLEPISSGASGVSFIPVGDYDPPLYSYELHYVDLMNEAADYEKILDEPVVRTDGPKVKAVDQGAPMIPLSTFCRDRGLLFLGWHPSFSRIGLFAKRL